MEHSEDSADEMFETETCCLVSASAGDWTTKEYKKASFSPRISTKKFSQTCWILNKCVVVFYQELCVKEALYNNNVATVL